MALTSADFTTNNSNGGSVTRTGNSVSMGIPGGGMIRARSNNAQNSNIIYAQCNLTWNPSNTQEQLGGILITAADYNISAASYTQAWNACISSRTDDGGYYRLSVANGGFAYSEQTTLSKGKDVKITYNTSNNQIKYWYWNTNQWTQIGTTQTFNILQGGNIKLYLYDNYLNGLGTETYTMNNIYFGNTVTDYTTQYPASAPTGNTSAFFTFLM